MNLSIGGQEFRDVEIPLLWGERAVLQDLQGRMSVIYLGGKSAIPEIIGDVPSPEVEFLPTANGYKILRDGAPVYSLDIENKILRGISLIFQNAKLDLTRSE